MGVEIIRIKAVLSSTGLELELSLAKKEEESAVLEATLAQLKLSCVEFELELG